MNLRTDTNRAESNRAEWALLAACALAVLLAAWLPATALPAGYHDFADLRAWGHVPHALDVLSNAPFALVALWLWRLQARWRHLLNEGTKGFGMNGSMRPLPPENRRQHTHTACALLRVIALGLLATALCSGVYHWQPHDASLCIDRLGMSLVFAGVMGLAVADRLSARAGLWLAAALFVAAMAAAMWAWQMGNMTPWAVLQGMGLLLLLAMAVCRPWPAAVGMGIPWAWVVLAYAAAKALELHDTAIFSWTGGWVAGHSLKHVVAALAVLPIGLALGRHGLPNQ